MDITLSMSMSWRDVRLSWDILGKLFYLIESYLLELRMGLYE